MSTGTAFQPTPFGSTVVAPGAVSAYRRAPYISPSTFRFAPTAVGTSALVPKSGNPVADSTQSLLDTIDRASAWADEVCFHRADGILAASLTTESDFVRPKPDGSLRLICNFKPVLEIVGLALGPMPSQLGNVGPNTAGDLWVQGKTIVVPGTWTTNTFPSFPMPRPTSLGGGMYAVWSYVNGWPHTALAAAASAGATIISLAPTSAGTAASSLVGVYKGSPLTIVDGAKTEGVIVQSVSGATLTLTAPLAFTHTLPATPDFIAVTALPRSLEQAVIFLTSVLLKMRGSRATVLAGAPGAPGRTAMAMAGALSDYEEAMCLLKPYTTVYLHG